ncbi:MAG TPA: hypothetical protein VIO85_12045 [Candidatus Dormibacteraeota bacterium]
MPPACVILFGNMFTFGRVAESAEELVPDSGTTLWGLTRCASALGTALFHASALDGCSRKCQRR